VAFLMALRLLTKGAAVTTSPFGMALTRGFAVERASAPAVTAAPEIIMARLFSRKGWLFMGPI
jgi:hypothetical protein